jgi:predicted DNA-binding transcriptional regulator AlpA
MISTAAKVLNVREVAALFKVTEKTIRNWVRAGHFPKPLAVGGKKLFWTEQEVERVLHRAWDKDHQEAGAMGGR